MTVAGTPRDKKSHATFFTPCPHARMHNSNTFT
jgi:hypothetical protein